MSSGLPVVSGRQLIRFLQSLGYRIDRQKGSHIRLERSIAGITHALTIPNHREIAKGTLNDILSAAGKACCIDKRDLINRLSDF